MGYEASTLACITVTCQAPVKVRLTLHSVCVVVWAAAAVVVVMVVEC
jgi:hypothetical protein